MKNFAKNFCLILGLAICIAVTSTFAQTPTTTRCDTACANDESCRTNKCALTRCSDSGTCYQFCLRCNEIETCYATGGTCDYSGNTIQVNSSNKMKYSYVLGIFLLTFLCISK